MNAWSFPKNTLSSFVQVCRVPFLKGFLSNKLRSADRYSSVGIETRYGLDGPGIESRWGEIFRTRPDQLCGSPSFLYSGYRVSFPWIKRLGRGVVHPSHLVPKVKERVELYLYSLSGPSWPVLGWTILYCIGWLVVSLKLITLFVTGSPLTFKAFYIWSPKSWLLYTWLNTLQHRDLLLNTWAFLPAMNQNI